MTHWGDSDVLRFAMRKFHALVLLVAATAALLVGCGGAGDGGEGTLFASTITGRVTFENGLPARDVQVTTRDSSGYTSTNGAYILEGNRAEDMLVTAQVTLGGQRYVGQTLTRTYDNEQATNANIMLVPESETATMTGSVVDANGRPLENATVFAISNNGISSTKAITNRFGEFTMPYLLSGVAYAVNAGGNGYRSDSDTFTFTPGETRNVPFALANPAGALLPPPTNLSAIAWTSPITRDRKAVRAIEAVKRAFDPGYAKRHEKTRLSPDGNPVEIEIQWDDVDSNEKLGYGIYRAVGGGGFTALEYFRDPLSRTFVDSDLNLNIDTIYSYRVTTLNTLYPDAADSESGPSEVVLANPLDDLILRNFDPVTTTIRWDHVAGAQNYVVYLYDDYPDFDVPPLWDTENSRTTSNEQRYNGPALTPGATYYYLVMGLADGDTARTLSAVGSFTY